MNGNLSHWVPPLTRSSAGARRSKNTATASEKLKQDIQDIQDMIRLYVRALSCSSCTSCFKSPCRHLCKDHQMAAWLPGGNFLRPVKRFMQTLDDLGAS